MYIQTIYKMNYVQKTPRRTVIKLFKVALMLDQKSFIFTLQYFYCTSQHRASNEYWKR